jgi:putative transposase
MNMYLNMIIKWAGNTEKAARMERVLWLEPSRGQVVMFDLKDELALPAWQDWAVIDTALTTAQVEVIGMDPYAGRLCPEEDIPAKHRERRDRAWRYIRPLVEDENGQPRVEIFLPERRGELVAAVAEEMGRTKRLIYRNLRRYWRGGQTKNALLPHFDQCGRKGQKRQPGDNKRGRPTILTQATGHPQGVNVDETIQQYFRRGIKLFYETSDRRSLAQAYRLTLEKFFQRGYETRNGVKTPALPPTEELPTLPQFRDWYRKERQTELSIRSRLGSRRFETGHRAVLGDSTRMAFGPGSLFQFDATPADIYLVSALDRLRIIGRPVVYMVIDVFSRLIVGFSVSLEGPSWLGAMLALENTMTDKVAFCQRYGLTITPNQWPSHHLPQKILADRGEMEGYNADHLVNGLGITVANTPPYRADWKGIVERYFRLSNDRVTRWLPGAVYPEREPGATDYRLEACLTMTEFAQIMLYCILEHNTEYRMDWYEMDRAMIADHVEPYPLELWEWGLQNRVGHLRTSSLETIRLELLPRGQASIARDGIHFQGLRYGCELRGGLSPPGNEVVNGSRSLTIPVWLT